MKKVFALILLVSTLTNAHAEEGVVKLTLNEAVKMAVERNLDVRAEIYNPAQFEADVQHNLAIYDPNLTLEFSRSYSPISLTNTGLTTSMPGFSDSSSGNRGAYPNTQMDTETDNYTTILNYSLSQLLPTGGTISAVYNNTYADAASSLGPLNKYWQVYAGFTFNQPLLKNFGRENTEMNISVSRLSKEASLEHFKSRLTTIVSQVRSEYFKLFGLRELLEARKVSLELARKILSETEARVKSGVLPALEILNAEFGVASREKDLNDAERLVRDQVDLLRMLLQLPVGTEIIPVDVPQRTFLEVNETEKISKALNRYDIMEQKKTLEIVKLQNRIYRNKILPDLSLNTSAYLTSLDTAYLGDIKNHPAWSVGLTLTYPLGNRSAENDYRKSRLKAEQVALQIKSLEESVANEVRSAIRTIVSSYKQIEVTDRARRFAENRLRSFIRKNEVGLATTKDVLDVENDLMNVKSNQIQALVDYNTAITRLWTVTGELLEQMRIHVSEDDVDQIYKNIH